MPDVHADAEKLRQFSKTLTSSADQLQQLTRSLSRALESTGWQGAERLRFEQDFKQTVRALSQHAEKLKGQYAPDLQKKAAALEQFHGR